MQTKILLEESEIPTHWYNVVADMPNPPAPPMGPDGKPVGPEALQAIFPDNIIEQEVSAERWISIPEEVREILALWRPSPLYRAHRLERALGTPARIYYKNESVSPAGSHKPNTAVAQAYRRTTTRSRVSNACPQRRARDSGDARWHWPGRCSGSMSASTWSRSVMNKSPTGASMMQTWGAEVFASPTDMTESGRKILAEHPDSPGSLGIAISEAAEEAAGRKDTNYSLGSVLNHVLLHQTVIGEEAKKQLALVGDYPDEIYAPCGGGSNFGGIAFPFFADKAAGKDVRLIAVEPTSCPTLTKGPYAYDFGDAIGLTPLLKMHTLGHDFVPPGIHAGGLRYHGDSPLVSQLHHEGLVDAIAIPQLETFEAGVLFARTEGIVSAPESTHAIAAAVRSARECVNSGEPRTILFNLSGHGHFDMSAYDRYLNNELEDYEFPVEAIEESLSHLPEMLRNP
jgi:tryptophan synthase beta chain